MSKYRVLNKTNVRYNRVNSTQFALYKLDADESAYFFVDNYVVYGCNASDDRCIAHAKALARCGDNTGDKL